MDMQEPTGALVLRHPPTMITAPGVYDIPADAYHADPAETPSLSAGMINDILAAPAKCRERSRRLNPKWEEDEKQDRFTIGTVSHIMFLEPHLFAEKVMMVRFDDWRSAAAKALRDEARATGKTPILSKHMDKVLAARDAFLAHDFAKHAFTGGAFEQSLFWRHPVHGFWCRARPDFLADSRTHMCDYKATGNADPMRFGKHADDLGYHRRAAWYLEGAEAVFGKRPEHYWFVNQETKAPYLVSVVELDTQALEAAQDENHHAAAIFAKCLATGDWYGYRHPDSLDRDRAFQVGLPPYAYMKIDERLGRGRMQSTAKGVLRQHQWEDEEEEAA